MKQQRNPMLDAVWRPELLASPHMDPVGTEREASRLRLQTAVNLQQPMAPDQLALVWRWDLMHALGDLIWREAQVDSLRGSLARAEARIAELERKAPHE